MKKIKTLLLIAVFTLGVSGVANAQKIAHIDAQRVLFNMPESRALTVTLEKLAKTYQDEIVSMGNKLDAKIKKYTAEQNTQSKDSNEKRAKDVQKEEAIFNAYRKTATEDLKERQANGLKPLSEKAFKAIEEIAAAKGILYVLDGRSLVVKKGEDLYDAVKAKLGLLKDLPQQQPRQ